MSIVSTANIQTYTGASSYSADLQAIHEGVERLVKNYCRKTFESASYFELYDGKGGYYRLMPKYQPITAVSRVSVDFDAVIKIKNSNTDATTASVKVDTTNVVLTVNGGAGNSTSTLAIATYSTLTLLVDAINALNSAYGWTAELYDSDYSAKKTALLIPQQIDVTSWLTAQEYSYLYMGEPISFMVVDNTWIEAYYPIGSQNVAISYTAGETPDDIEYAVMALVKATYDKKLAGADGIKRFTVGDIETEFFEAINNQESLIGQILNDNRKVMI